MVKIAQALGSPEIVDYFDYLTPEGTISLLPIGV
jgi:hypothetical protein